MNRVSGDTDKTMFPDNCIQVKNQNWIELKQSSMFRKSNTMQDKRMISISKLNTLLRLYPRPINVVVFHDPYKENLS